ncbi:hypothetical protein D3C72_2342490 [compost metagenome]
MRCLQRRANLRGDAGSGPVDLLGADAQVGSGEMVAVEPVGQLDHGRIAPGLHVGNDAGHDVIDVAAGLALAVQEFLEARFKIGIGAVEAKRHGGP